MDVHITGTKFANKYKLFIEDNKEDFHSWSGERIVKRSILSLKDHQYSADYQKRLEVQWLLFGKLSKKRDEYYADNDSIHVLYSTKQCFGRNQVAFTTALGSDLNAMKNLWGALVSDTCAKKRQFATV